MSALFVWREYLESIEIVGSLSSVDGDIRFAYDESYRGEAISASLPVTAQPCSSRATACFFSALLPEGAARREIASMLHASTEDFLPFLERLNDESLGALLFSTETETPCSHPSYKLIEDDFFHEFAARPLETATTTLGRTRLSLAGGMAKVGLYRDEKTGRWYYPLDGAPSTHIIKAAEIKRFPLETLNEALCLGAARRCNLPVAECSLIATDRYEPLLAVRRFDRTFDNPKRQIDGLAVPSRLHQEDFSQATSISLKYEPTDGNYLSLITSAAREQCANAFGEACLLVEYTMFNYLIGNCDNHLKNYALLMDKTWRTKEVAPLYDTVSTVAYPEIYLEMGVSFGGDRRIDHVNRELVTKTVQRCGIPPTLALNIMDNLAKDLPGAVEAEADELAHAGFEKSHTLLTPLINGIEERRHACEK